jgi:hypothetical protein
MRTSTIPINSRRERHASHTFRQLKGDLGRVIDHVERPYAYNPFLQIAEGYDMAQELARRELPTNHRFLADGFVDQDEALQYLRGEA